MYNKECKHHIKSLQDSISVTPGLPQSIFVKLSGSTDLKLKTRVNIKSLITLFSLLNLEGF